MLSGEKPYIGINSRVDRLTEKLRNLVKPGEDVYYFDWVEGGVSHALFNLKIPLSHRYTTDQIFKHHLHSPEKKALINNFLNALLFKIILLTGLLCL